MHFNKIIILLLSLTLFLVGCNHQESSYQDKPNIERISTNSHQDAATKAKELLMDRDDIKAVHAVNTEDILLITVETPHHERFNLEDIRKKYQKELEKAFPNFSIELSTDKKIGLETTKLEEKIAENTITKDEIKKKMKKIIQLSKEQT
ncbi:hypothetical protein [Oceanobacillus sp. J11TS1]|uniref:hypothetical protein n=1 Tax=Oceanobacillus sp. J11TS1 TaxID=2807191 RepID=UPI001B0E566D|nr:hypothetical protein [Oceanobacillus sp. J11TS1]GIO22379.1 hypothetical protein J11TS1_09600 [Oceanobacillus sp. J11TS1]